MKCKEAIVLIDALDDDQLSGNENDLLLEHLFKCNTCQKYMDETRQLKCITAELPQSIAPPHDLWPELSKRINKQRVIKGSFNKKHYTWPQILGAAAGVLVAASLTLTIFISHQKSTEIAEGEPVVASQGNSTSTSTTSGDKVFQKARAELFAAWQVKSEALSPQTMAVFNNGLKTIDESIHGIGVALANNPDDPKLTRLLASAQRQAIDLLLRAVAVPEEA